MRKITCDRCGAVIVPETYDNTGYISMRWRGYYGSGISGINPFENCDYCDSCMDEIKAFISTPKMCPVTEVDKSPDEAPEAEASDAGQDPEEPKVKPKRKYHRLDDELLKQYAGQGLTCEEIKMRLYDEHGIICNRQTVANHLKKAGL